MAEPSVISRKNSEAEAPFWLMTDDRGFQIIVPKKKGQKKEVRKQSDYVGFPLYAQQQGYIPSGKFLNIPISYMTLKPYDELGFLPVISGINENAQKGILCHSNIIDYKNFPQPPVIVTLFNFGSELFTVKTDVPIAHLYCVKTAVLAVDMNDSLRLIDAK